MIQKSPEKVKRDRVRGTMMKSPVSRKRDLHALTLEVMRASV